MPKLRCLWNIHLVPLPPDGNWGCWITAGRAEKVKAIEEFLGSRVRVNMVQGPDILDGVRDPGAPEFTLVSLS